MNVYGWLLLGCAWALSCYCPAIHYVGILIAWYHQSHCHDVDALYSNLFFVNAAVWIMRIYFHAIHMLLNDACFEFCLLKMMMLAVMKSMHRIFLMNVLVYCWISCCLPCWSRVVLMIDVWMLKMYACMLFETLENFQRKTMWIVLFAVVWVAVGTFPYHAFWMMFGLNFAWVMNAVVCWSSFGVDVGNIMKRAWLWKPRKFECLVYCCCDNNNEYTLLLFWNCS